MGSLTRMAWSWERSATPGTPDTLAGRQARVALLACSGIPGASVEEAAFPPGPRQVEGQPAPLPAAETWTACCWMWWHEVPQPALVRSALKSPGPRRRLLPTQLLLLLLPWLLVAGLPGAVQWLWWWREVQPPRRHPGAISQGAWQPARRTMGPRARSGPMQRPYKTAKICKVFAPVAAPRGLHEPERLHGGAAG